MQTQIKRYLEHMKKKSQRPSTFTKILSLKKKHDKNFMCFLGD